MAMNSFGVGFVLNAADKVSPVLSKISSGFHKMFYDAKESGDKLTQTLARGAIGEGLRRFGVGITQALGQMAADAGPLEQAARNVRAVRGELSGATVDMMRSFNASDFARIGFTAQDAARAFETLALTGNSAADAEAHMGDALRLARIGMMDTAQAGAMLDEWQDVFGGTLDDSQQRIDKVAWSMRQWGLSGSQIGQMLAATAGSAQLVNASFEDMLAATSMVGTVIPNVGKAASSVQQAFMQLASEKTQKDLKAMGIEVQSLDGKFAGLGPIIGSIIEKTQGLSEAQRATKLRELFGSRAAGGMAVIFDTLEKGVKTTTGEVLKGAEAMSYLTSEMEKSGGEAAKMAEGMTSITQASEAQSNRLKTTIGSIFRGIMDPFKKFKGEAMGGLADALERFSPETQKALVGIVAGLGTLVATTGGLIIATTVLDRLGVSFKGLLLSGIKLLLMGGPLVLLLGAIGGGLYAAFSAIEARGKGSVTIIDKIKVGWKGVLDLLSTRTLSDETKKALASPEMQGVSGFLEWMDGFLVKWDVFWIGIKEGWAAGMTALGPEVDKFLLRFDSLGAIFGGGKAADDLDAWGAAGRRAGEGLTSIASIGLEILTALLDMMERLGEKLGAITADDVANGIIKVVDGFKMFYNIVKGVWNFLVAIKDVIMIIASLYRAYGAFLGQLGYKVSAPVEVLAGRIFGDMSEDEARGKLESARGIDWGAIKDELYTAVEHARGYTDEEKAAEDARSERRAKQMEIIRMRQNYNAILASGREQLGLIEAGGFYSGEKRDRAREYNRELMNKLSSLADGINKLAGKELVARVEYETLGKAINRAIGDEEGRSLTPAVGSAY